MSDLFLEQINAEAIRAEWENTRSRTLKRELIKEGYSHQISLYGILTNDETEASQYSRIEVLCDTPITGREVALMHDFFKELKPLDVYTIWKCRTATLEVQLMGRFN